MKYAPLPPQGHLKDLFDYEAETGILRWKYRPAVRKTWNTRFAGKPAGLLNRGYVLTNVNGKRYFAHRIIWAWVHGSMPCDMQIDHVNGDPSDNRLANLRLATNAQNAWNGPARARNKVGMKGVSLHRASGLWRARVVKGGKETTKYFKTPEEARVAYAETAKRRFGKFARAD